MFPLDNELFGSPDSSMCNHFDEDEDIILNNEVFEINPPNEDNVENDDEATDDDINAEASALLVSASSPSASPSAEALEESINNDDLSNNTNNFNYNLNFTADKFKEDYYPMVYSNSSPLAQSAPETISFNYLLEALQVMKMMQRYPPPPPIIHEERDILDLGSNITENWEFTHSVAPMSQSLNYYVFGETTSNVRASNIRKQRLLQLQQQQHQQQQQQYLQQDCRRNGANGFKRYPHNHR